MPPTKYPKISVVTVCYQAEEVIQTTLESVLAQNYPSLEYIIIDGASEDRTLPIIESLRIHFKHKGIAMRVYSEPDAGVYDAMNKGIERCNGEWVNFMNAGDTFFSPEVLNQIFDQKPAPAIIYGNTLMRKSIGKFLVEPKPLHRLDKKMPFCHQSVFMPTAWLRKKPFDLQYRILADYNLFRYHYLKGADFRYIPITISIFEAEDGISSIYPLKRFEERQHILGKNKQLTYPLHYMVKYMAYQSKSIVKTIIPLKAIESLRDFNYNRKIKRNSNKNARELQR